MKRVLLIETTPMVKRLRAENTKLRCLLKHADDVVIWEHTYARSGFQEEIEEVLGIGGETVELAIGGENTNEIKQE